MIYLDHNGELRVKASASMAGCGGAIFTPEVTDNFVKLANPSPVASTLPSMNASELGALSNSSFSSYAMQTSWRLGADVSQSRPQSIVRWISVHDPFEPGSDAHRTGWTGGNDPMPIFRPE